MFVSSSFLSLVLSVPALYVGKRALPSRPRFGDDGLVISIRRRQSKGRLFLTQTAECVRWCSEMNERAAGGCCSSEQVSGKLLPPPLASKENDKNKKLPPLLEDLLVESFGLFCHNVAGFCRFIWFHFLLASMGSRVDPF